MNSIPSYLKKVNPQDNFENSLEYLSHVSGLYFLYDWLFHLQSKNCKVKTKEQYIIFDEFASLRFMMCIPRNKSYGKHAFLAAPQSESGFLSLMQWDRAVFKENDPFLYLVTKVVKGDGENYPDLPSFVLCLKFDGTDKTSVFANGDRLQAKTFYFDTNNEPKIVSRKNLFDVPIVSLSNNAEILAPHEVTVVNTYTAIIKKKLEPKDSYKKF